MSVWWELMHPIAMSDWWELMQLYSVLLDVCIHVLKDTMSSLRAVDAEVKDLPSMAMVLMYEWQG